MIINKLIFGFVFVSKIIKMKIENEGVLVLFFGEIVVVRFRFFSVYVFVGGIW